MESDSYEIVNLSIRSKVLVVDDLVANHRAVASVIEHLPIEIFYAASGAEALRLVMKNRFAIILMDVHMPEMDGIETTRLIHGTKTTKDVPIVMLTASAGCGDLLLEAYGAGAVDYVVKPVVPIILVNKVRQFVELELQHRLVDTARKEQAETNARMTILLNSGGEGVLGIDLTGAITFANPKAAAIFNAEQSVLLHNNIDQFFFDEKNDSAHWNDSILHGFMASGTAGASSQERWQTLGNASFDVEYSSDPMRDSNGKQIGSVVMFQDITERKAIEANLKYLATYDALTNLMNRAYFHDSLLKAISRAKRTKDPLCVLMLDLDHFKFINDKYGHGGGDLLLKVVSKRLAGSIREGDVVARLGGDEFGMILYDVHNVNDALPVAQKIITAVGQNIELEEATVNVSCSIGIYQYDDYSLEMDEVIKNADTALYEAKEEGRNNYQVFALNMRKEVVEKQRIQMLLQRALADDEFYLVYQPKVSISKKKIVGCEALLRWQPKDEVLAGGTPLGPAVFIPIAEESGQIVEIGDWVLESACKQAIEWKQKGFTDCVVSVNVSTRQLRTGEFHQRVKEVFNRYDITPSMIELEVTETGVLDDQKRTIDELEKINEMGVKISIDDFGTGNSSLDYLRKLPLDTLKIDRSFVVDIGVDTQDEELIRVMLAISQTMELDVIAEGVETVEQLCFLAENQCDVIQGYYFSKPVSAADMTTLFENAQQDAQQNFVDEFEVFNQYVKKNGVENPGEAQRSLEKDMRFVADFLEKDGKDENEDKKRLEGK